MARKEKHEVKRKEMIYRGQPLEQLQSMDVRESAKFLKSRPRRAVLRNFDSIERFIKLCEMKNQRKKKIKTHRRDVVIVPKLVGLTIGVHNGKDFQEVPITVEMIGHRLGEFSQTRNKVNHGSAGIGATKSSRAQKK
jgi:small subunit ribosomal protein S19